MILVILAGVVVWASLRSPGPSPIVASTTANAAPAIATDGTTDNVPQATPAASVSTSGLVRLDASVSDPAAPAVLALLDRHFGAINARDYAAWSTTVVPQRAAHQPMSTWTSAYRSTQDQNVEVSAITANGSDSVDVALTFMSTQDPADAPPDLQVSRICWRSTWPVVDLGAGGRIGTPSRGATSHAQC